MAQIHNVTEYNFYGSLYFDVFYESGRLVSYHEDRLPASVKNFLKDKKGEPHFSTIYNRVEIKYIHD